MKTYKTNEAILITEGNYTYEVLKGKDDQELQEKARQWLKTHENAISAINEGDVIDHIWKVFRIEPKIEPSNNKLVMEPGDEALVVRKRPVPDNQGTYVNTGESVSRVRAPWEYGILKRIS